MDRRLDWNALRLLECMIKWKRYLPSMIKNFFCSPEPTFSWTTKCMHLVCSVIHYCFCFSFLFVLFVLWFVALFFRFSLWYVVIFVGFVLYIWSFTWSLSCRRMFCMFIQKKKKKSCPFLKNIWGGLKWAAKQLKRKTRKEHWCSSV